MSTACILLESVLLSNWVILLDYGAALVWFEHDNLQWVFCFDVNYRSEHHDELVVNNAKQPVGWVCLYKYIHSLCRPDLQVKYKLLSQYKCKYKAYGNVL